MKSTNHALRADTVQTTTNNHAIEEKKTADKILKKELYYFLRKSTNNTHFSLYSIALSTHHARRPDTVQAIGDGFLLGVPGNHPPHVLSWAHH